MEEKLDQPPSLFKQLFCKHEWERIGNLRIFANNGDQYPIKELRRWECTKCRDIKEQRIL